MPQSSQIPIVFTTVLAFCSLYAPQPILPLLAEQFAVSQARSSLLITLVLLPLSLAPVLYGFVLETFSAHALLRASVLLLALSQAAFVISEDFLALCAIRLFQGLLLPAIFTALMTYCSTMARPQTLRQVMSVYIAATIAGGFFGRAVTGLIADLGNWRHAFLLWLGGLFAAWLLLGRLPADTRANVHRIEPRKILAVLRQREFSRVYLMVFFTFFVFASVLNVLPFEMKALHEDISETAIALAYSGYLIGIAVALGCDRMSAALGGEARVIRVGLGVYGLGLLLFSTRSVAIMYLAMVLFCAGMFTVHTVASGYVNHLARSHKGVVNGLYIACYYGGGTLGSFLPVLIYRASDWTTYLIVLAVLVTAAAALSLAMQNESER